MGLFDRLLKHEPAAVPPPTGVDVHPEADTLYAPVSGRVATMAEVPDPVFSGEVLGAGCAVWPDGDVIYAPASGKVSVTMGHAVGLITDDGIELLVHIGVDTVNLQGKGFTGFVKQGDAVSAGQALIRFDSDVIKEAGYEDCVVLAVSNTAEFADVAMIAQAGSTVSAGDAVVKITRK
ncbi:PTS system IIA component, Glc family [Coriobacterium glomerans PW2]|uniref:PTS system IIA component, Glc family n=1 Tax=Coriobacterium glomerans (strain ATCC 49209 / DSM 20642 / JCM 10262 / PW2) TaxID=700015 RepID=F2NAT4_CORGP|nr:PTS glucose transporter subunit IIA [Coriobacterium glomerans]AEB07540.1 PTS system IIA component, Glc family [Coriobacterium glomerans PW2]